MKREILLARGRGESQGAVLTDGTLTDYRAAGARAPSLVGAVFSAKVTKVVPGLDAAIVALPGGEAWLDLSRGSMRTVEGAAHVVQIVRDAHAEKLPRASLEVVIPGRHLALQAFGGKPGLSHRIVDNDARARLGALLAAFGKEGLGTFIALHRAAGAGDAVLRREAARLKAAWRPVYEKLFDAVGVGEVVPAPDPALDLLRIFVGPECARIAVDGEALARTVKTWLADEAPEWQGAVEREPVGRTTLESAEVRAALDEALAPEVPLGGGGVLAVAAAGGMTVIDVDTDRAASLSAKASFARVNREAAAAIAHQIRLRNLGGRIVVDFAGLGAPRHLAAALGELRRGIADDPLAVRIARPSEFGLVEMIRRRERRTLAEMLAKD